METTTVTSTMNQNPCLQSPLQESHTSSSFPNGTGAAEIDYPVFALAPGAQGTICVTVSNASNSTVPEPSLAAYAWGNSSEATGISFSENPANASIPPRSNVTVFYTLKPSSISAGPYRLGVNGTGCDGTSPLLVTANESASSFSDFPGLLNDLTAAPGSDVCFGSYYAPLEARVVGFSGLAMVDLRYGVQFSMPFHEVSRSIQSTVLSPKEQNVTVTLGIQSYGLPVTVELLEGPYKDNTYIARWAGDPQEVATTGDPCDWLSSNNYANDYDALEIQISGVTVDAPTLHLQPYSNGTFTFSIRIWNLTGGFTGEGLGAGNSGYVSGGYFAADFSAYVVWGNSTDTATYANLDLTSFFPLGAIGPTLSGACTAPAETAFTNLPWYLNGLQPF
jgi:hypothetical protein